MTSGGIGDNLGPGKMALALHVDRCVDLCDFFVAFGQSWQGIGTDIPHISDTRPTLAIAGSVNFISDVSFCQAQTVQSIFFCPKSSLRDANDFHGRRVTRLQVPYSFQIVRTRVFYDSPCLKAVHSTAKGHLPGIHRFSS
jgi:hypothetical protein